MKIQARSKPNCVAGRRENYKVIIVYRRCGSRTCPGRLEKPIAAPDPPVLRGCSLDIEVQAWICELRFRYHRTEAEIAQDLERECGITVCLGTIGNIIRHYEIGCSQKYKPAAVAKIRENGGIIMTLDAMEPLKGEPAIYMARDEITGMKIAARQLSNKKQETIEKFLVHIKNLVDTELQVPVKAIVCDAQKELVAAARIVFPGVNICLCEYHFYKLVLKVAKEVDSHVLTTVRAILRKMGEIKKFRYRDGATAGITSQPSLVDEILETLHALSNWTRKPRDPCFSGLELRSRIVDVAAIVREACTEVGKDIFTSMEEATLGRVRKGLTSCIGKTAYAAGGLERIRGYLASIVTILDAEGESADQGLARLQALSDELIEAYRERRGTKAERAFVEALAKYVRTKGTLLFNHRRVSGAPGTNNNHELSHMSLKHHLRRTIGHAAASHYLLVHGERIVFVDPGETLEGIKEILKRMDHKAAREIIEKERKSRSAISIVMHAGDKWKEKMARLRARLQEMQRAKTTTT